MGGVVAGWTAQVHRDADGDDTPMSLSHEYTLLQAEATVACIDAALAIHRRRYALATVRIEAARGGLSGIIQITTEGQAHGVVLQTTALGVDAGTQIATLLAQRAAHLCESDLPVQGMRLCVDAAALIAMGSREELAQEVVHRALLVIDSLQCSTMW